MKNFMSLMVAVFVLLPAKEVRNKQVTMNVDGIMGMVARSVAHASSRDWFNVAVYLPDVKPFERAKALDAVRAMGYKVTEGSGVNEIIVSW